MTGKQLKNAILQLAIQGKLVPQDANDEPASALLAKIRKEKEQLVKAGKLKPACRQAGKKDLATTPITDEEKPFEIPESWEWVRLNELFHIVSARRVHQKDWRSSGIPFYRTREIGWLSENKKVSTELFIEEKLFNEFSKTGCPVENDIMMTAVGTIGKTYIVKKEDKFYYKDASVLCLENFSKVDPKFYCYLFDSSYFKEMAADGAMGTTVATITMVRANEYSVPLPPLAEQHRIVSKIEELMPLVEEYGAAQEKLNRLNEALPDALKKSILQQAIQGKLVPQDANDEPASALLVQIRKEKEQLVKAGKLKPACRQAGKKDLETTPITDEEKPFEIPESWEWVRLGEICTRMFNGKSPKYSKTPTDHKVIGQAANLWDKVHLEYTKYAMPDFVKDMDDYYYLQENDVLLNTLGNGTLGRSGIFKGIKENILTDGHIFVIRTMEEATALYILAFLRYSFIDINKSADGTTNQTFLSLGKTSKWLIPLPPLSEQQRIVAKIEELMALVDGMK